MRRILPSVVAATMLTLVYAEAPASAAAPLAGPSPASAATGAAPAAAAAAAPRKRRTPFAFTGAGFGTKVDGADIPASSQKTGFSIYNCTNVSGRNFQNYLAEAELPGAGVLAGADTRLYTRQKGKGRNKTYSSISTNKIAQIKLAEIPGLGSLAINGITSRSRAFWRAGEYNATNSSNIGSIRLTGPGGIGQNFPLPTPNQPVTVPGVATISLGKPVRKVSKKGALAFSTALKIDIIPTGTKVLVSNARARIDGGIQRGVFSGTSAGLKARALDDNLRIGRTPARVMPCGSTNGALQTSNLVDVDLAGQIVVEAAQASQKSRQNNASASGFEQGKIARVAIGGDALVINAIKGRAFVKRTAKKLVRKADAQVGTITAGGEVQELPDTGVLEIPGVATLERGVTKRVFNGIEVVGLRITLLDGTGAVVDLGLARLRIAPGKMYR